MTRMFLSFVSMDLGSLTFHFSRRRPRSEALSSDRRRARKATSDPANQLGDVPPSASVLRLTASRTQTSVRQCFVLRIERGPLRAGRPPGTRRVDHIDRHGWMVAAAARCSLSASSKFVLDERVGEPQPTRRITSRQSFDPREPPDRDVFERIANGAYVEPKLHRRAPHASARTEQGP
jgi:hypothetical protein